jgi:hypothetical protein
LVDNLDDTHENPGVGAVGGGVSGLRGGERTPLKV